MKLGLQPFDLGIGVEAMYQKFAAAGFQSIDFPWTQGYKNPIWQLSDLELKAKAETEKELMSKYGLFAGQTHAPMDANWQGDISTKEARLHAQVQAIKATSYLGAPYIVVHPITRPYRMNQEKYEQAKAIDMEFYRFLEPYAKEYGVKIAIENLFAYDPILQRYCETAYSTAEHLIDYVETLNSDCFVVCLDVGHAKLGEQNPVDMIYKLGNKYLKVLHVHDNDGVDDKHLMPGMGTIDWYGIGKALHDIGYDGVFNYESPVPFGLYGPYRLEMVDKLLKVYVEVGKAITDSTRYQ